MKAINCVRFRSLTSIYTPKFKVFWQPHKSSCLPDDLKMNDWGSIRRGGARQAPAVTLSQAIPAIS